MPFINNLINIKLDELSRQTHSEAIFNDFYGLYTEINNIVATLTEDQKLFFKTEYRNERVRYSYEGFCLIKRHYFENKIVPYQVVDIDIFNKRISKLIPEIEKANKALNRLNSLKISYTNNLTTKAETQKDELRQISKESCAINCKLDQLDLSIVNEENFNQINSEIRTSEDTIESLKLSAASKTTSYNEILQRLSTLGNPITGVVASDIIDSISNLAQDITAKAEAIKQNLAESVNNKSAAIIQEFEELDILANQMRDFSEAERDQFEPTMSKIRFKGQFIDSLLNEYKSIVQIALSLNLPIKYIPELFIKGLQETMDTAESDFLSISQIAINLNDSEVSDSRDLVGESYYEYHTINTW